MKSQKITLLLLVLLAILSTVMFLKPDLLGLKNNVDESREADALKELGFFKFSSPRPLAEIPLKKLNGEETTLAGLHQQWQLVNFGYMFCPDICPINLRLMGELKEEWDAPTPFEITHITFDPERDTPDRLQKYLDYINPDYAGLTGEIENIRKVAQQLNTVFIFEKPDEYGNYFITHSDSIALINPKGEYVGLFKGPYDKEKVKQALKILIN
jgi:protein SCO1/2